MFKPTDWSLEPHKRYLKGILKGLQPTNSEAQGITQADLSSSETFAWHIILSRCVQHYDLSTWSTAPPLPLFEIWDLLGSANVLMSVSQRKNIEDPKGKQTWEMWIKMAGDMLTNIVDPRIEGERIDLINMDGTLHPKRANIAVPVVINTTGVQFFPVNPSYDYQIPGSVAQFIQEHFKQRV